MRFRGMRTLARGPLWEQLLAGGFVGLGETPGHEVLAGEKAYIGHAPKAGK